MLKQLGWKMCIWWNATDTRKMGFLAVAPQVLEMTQTRTTLKVSSPNILFDDVAHRWRVKAITVFIGSRGSDSYTFFLSFTYHFSKSFIWKLQGSKKPMMRNEQIFDQVKVRQWIYIFAPGIDEAIHSCPPFKWKTKPLLKRSFSSSDGLHVFTPH